MSSTGPWSAYTPDAQTPWKLRRVVHLHRRAGFAATWDEIERDRKEGPQASVDRLLRADPKRQGVPPEFVPTVDLLADSAVGAVDPARLKAWWVYRMLFGPDPLGERLALVWHNHFATSNLKVEDLAAMRRQNELFRALGRDSFRKLLPAVVRDPALLVWLDAPANRKGHPNENLARELMELFTLGIGHYSEADVQEAARALTGWTVVDGAFRHVAVRHDAGEKTVFGHKGRWTGDDLLRLLLDRPAAAERLAFRICTWLMAEGAVAKEAIQELARGLRDHDLDIGWAVETVLRSRAFFAEANLGRRVVSPVEYVVGAARALELFDPPSSTLVLAEWTTRLGQDLFYPPNVGGWPGGRSWLTTRSVLGRARFALALVEGADVGRRTPLDALGLARRHGAGTERNDLLAFYTRLLLGREPSPARRERVLAGLEPSGDVDRDGRRIVALVLASPEAQLA
jgi:uncharacterized protein (DUF1800 family)